MDDKFTISTDPANPTLVTNVRKIEAPEPPAYGVLGEKEQHKVVGWSAKDAKPETEIDALRRRVAALERAVNGRVSE